MIKVEFKMKSGFALRYECLHVEEEWSFPAKRVDLETAVKELLIEVARLRGNAPQVAQGDDLPYPPASVFRGEALYSADQVRAYALARQPSAGDAQTRRDTLLSVLGALNSNPYNLTKSECVGLVRGMFHKANAALAAKGKS